MHFFITYINNKNQKRRSLKKLQEKFKENVKYVNASYHVDWNYSENILSSCDKLTAECVQVTNLVEGIQKAVMIKKPVTFNKGLNSN